MICFHHRFNSSIVSNAFSMLIVLFCIIINFFLIHHCDLLLFVALCNIVVIIVFSFVFALIHGHLWSTENGFDITFTTKRQDVKSAISLIENNKKIKYEKMYMNDKVSKISIVGAGMVATPGITFKMFRSLADANINLLAISTSEIKISVIIDEKFTIDAVKKLHKTFKLD